MINVLLIAPAPYRALTVLAGPDNVGPPDRVARVLLHCAADQRTTDHIQLPDGSYDHDSIYIYILAGS